MLDEIRDALNTQCNRATSDPMFAVQQKKRIYGMSPDYCDEYEWINSADFEHEADEGEVAQLEAKDATGASLGDWHKAYYVDTWEFVTCCFTEQGCKDYIAANGHNLNQPRIYVYSAYRNHEFNAVRKALMDGKFETEGVT